MTQSNLSSVLTHSANLRATVSSSATRPLFRKTIDWLVAARSHRVICLMAGMWLINAVLA